MEENEAKMRDAVIAMITRFADNSSVERAKSAAVMLKALANWDAVHGPPANSPIRSGKGDDEEPDFQRPTTARISGYLPVSRELELELETDQVVVVKNGLADKVDFNRHRDQWLEIELTEEPEPTLISATFRV